MIFCKQTDRVDTSECPSFKHKSCTMCNGWWGLMLSYGQPNVYSMSVKLAELLSYLLQRKFVGISNISADLYTFITSLRKENRWFWHECHGSTCIFSPGNSFSFHPQPSLHLQWPTRPPWKTDHSCWAGAPMCVSQYTVLPITTSDWVPSDPHVHKWTTMPIHDRLPQNIEL